MVNRCLIRHFGAGRSTDAHSLLDAQLIRIITKEAVSVDESRYLFPINF